MNVRGPGILDDYADAPMRPHYRVDAPMRAKGPKRPNRQTKMNHI